MDASLVRRRTKPNKRSNQNSSSQEDEDSNRPATSSVKSTTNLDSFLSEPVNSLNLALFRIAFGLMMSFLQYRALFWQDIIDHNFNYAEMNFHFFFARGIPKISLDNIIILFFISSIAALGMAIGLLYRVSCGVFLISYTYLNLLEKSRYNNHFYLYILMTFFFLITDGHKRASLDSLICRMFKTKESSPSCVDTRVPFWQIAIFRFQLFVVYFYAGIAKLNYDWFLRFEPMTIWSTFKRFSFFREFAGIFLQENQIQGFLGCFFSVGGVFFDLFIGFFLLVPKLKLLGFLMTVFFHVSNHFLFRIGTFPWVMMAANVLFLHPDTLSPSLTNFQDKLAYVLSSFSKSVKPNTSDQQSKAQTQTSPKHLSKPLKGFLVTYVLIQLLVPFRHWLYPGNVNWTLEGHQFSWRMMLNEEEVIMRIDIEGKLGHRAFDPYDLRLALRQIKRMLTDPDMVVQLVSHIKSKYVEEEDHEAAIKVDMWKALNGRPYQRYISNSVDLSVVSQNSFSYDWIIPQMQDDVIDFHKIERITKELQDELHDIRFYMESANQTYSTFLKPYFCDTVTLFSLNSPLKYTVGTITIMLQPGENVTVPSNEIHTIVTGGHAPTIWYYVFDCHVSLFHQAQMYISTQGWKHSPAW